MEIKLLNWVVVKFHWYVLHFHYFFFCSTAVISTNLSSSSLIRSSTSSGQLLNPSSIVFSSVITSVWYFLIFSIALLKFLLCSFIILPSLVGIFMIITLNYLSGRLLIFVSLRIFNVFSRYFIWSISLCFFNLLDCLCWLLSIRLNSYLFQSCRSGLMWEMNAVIQPCPSSWLFLKSL